MRGIMLDAHELAAGLHRSHAGRSRSPEGVANAARRQIADDLVHHCVRLDGRMAKGAPAAARRNDMPPLVGQLALRVMAALPRMDIDLAVGLIMLVRDRQDRMSTRLKPS